MHRITSFSWRHRFVPGAASKRPARLDGMVAAVETYMLESQKGSRHLTRRARGAIHLNNVNGWHARFKNWLKRFNGIASRYLVTYSDWQRFLDDGELRTPAQLLAAIVQCASCRRKKDE